MKNITMSLSFLLALIFLVSYSFAEETAYHLSVFKHPQCGCCTKWINHLQAHGFNIETKNLNHAALGKVKEKYRVDPYYQSCHTAVFEEQGYIFEGHIPADIIKHFLKESPEGAIGLAVPGMPVGSPGMEVGDRKDDYQVLLLKEDGSSEVYVSINH